MFSKACEYALRAAVFLAQQSSVENKFRVEEIAAGIDAPRSFTAKILQQLHRKEVILSTQGRHGGFYLTEDLKKQPVWNILAAFGEEQRLTGCVMGLHQCNDKKPCPLHEQYKGVRQLLAELFHANEIAAIAGAIQKSNAFIKNQ